MNAVGRFRRNGSLISSRKTRETLRRIITNYKNRKTKTERLCVVLVLCCRKNMSYHTTLLHFTLGRGRPASSIKWGAFSSSAAQAGLCACQLEAAKDGRICDVRSENRDQRAATEVAKHGR